MQKNSENGAKLRKQCQIAKTVPNREHSFLVPIALSYVEGSHLAHSCRAPHSKRRPSVGACARQVHDIRRAPELSAQSVEVRV